MLYGCALVVVFYERVEVSCCMYTEHQSAVTGILSELYHLKSGLPDRIDHFEDYERDKDAIEDILHDFEPTAKFDTQIEFELVEVALKGHLNNPEIDGMLKVIQKVNKDDSDFRF
ncbi:hypothetical protein EIP86_007560 [Pleurotus ostreatoroseus]|nr:hypothetical protein EIP86_007560 [Pleurotus ostreatoroseus]